MKQAIIICKPILLFFFPFIIGTRVFADSGFEKKKTLNYSYSLSSAKSFGIDNQFGDVTIKATSGNEIKVDIEITAEAASEERAMEIIDRVSISETGTPNIFFKTTLKKEVSSGLKRSNQKFSINYIVQLPGSLPLTLENQFGGINLGDYSGLVNVHSKFGNFTSGNLSNAEKIVVEFGKIKCGDLAGNAVVDIKYSNGSIGEVNGTFKCNVEFSNLGSITLGNNAKDVNIKNSYSNTDIKVSPGFSATYSIYTNFGKFINKTDFNIVDRGDDENDRHKPNFDNDYSGTSGNGANKVAIKSSFGNVKLIKL